MISPLGLTEKGLVKMSKYVVIGDVHLKPVMFDKADKILKSGQADFAIQMGDLVDDWGQEYNIDLYERTLNRAIKFHKDHPDTIWIYGNHDYLYTHPHKGLSESGHSELAEMFIPPLLEQLPQQLIYVDKGVIFTHAGLTFDWMADRLDKVGYDGVNRPDDKGIAHIVNHSTPEELWREDSPIWARPHLNRLYLWPARLQVCGHTPVKDLRCLDRLLETDTHSTYNNGAPFGDRSFAIVDTETGEWEQAKEEQ